LKYFYVICPVGADANFLVKRSALEDVSAECGLTPFFPLDHHHEFSIETVSRDIKLAAFVLADLSLERPSCYFELGMAEVLGARVLLIAAAGTPIHQVGSFGEVTFYSDMAQYRSTVFAMLASYLAAQGGH
jgi:hypothetical protein